MALDHLIERERKMATLKDADEITKTIKEIARRVRKGRDAAGAGDETAVLAAVLADAETQSLLADDDALDSMALALIDQIVWDTAPPRATAIEAFGPPDLPQAEVTEHLRAIRSTLDEHTRLLNVLVDAAGKDV